jgi:hypothetical protein
MAEANFVRLVEGIPKSLHFVDHTLTRRKIRDPETGFEKEVQVLVFRVDYEDGRKVDKTFSVIQQKLASFFTPYLAGKTYRDVLFTITKIGTGFTTEFKVETSPYAS